MAQKKKVDNCVTANLPAMNFTLAGVIVLLTMVKCYFLGEKWFPLNLATTQYCTKFSITVELPATNFTLVGGTLMFSLATVKSYFRAKSVFP
eukprot:SAG11_NODE_3064_length_2717_cov_1.713140_1_plen_92_part_00